MGGIGVQVTAPGEVADIWRTIRERLGKLVTSKSGRDVLNFYLSFQSDDGLEDGGSWHRKGDSVWFFFGDAAGLCYLEMDLCHHWVSLVAAELGIGEKPLQEVLEKPAESTFAAKGGKMVRVAGAAPCACEVCRKYRTKLGIQTDIPRKAGPPKPPPRIAETAAPVDIPLAHATIHTDIKTPELIVALDLSSSWGGKVKAGVFAKLPTLPLKALNLKGQHCFALPPPVFHCTHLEVLGVNNTLNSKRAVLSPALSQLQNLKGLSISLPAQEEQGLEIIGQLANLEALDGYWMTPQFPDSFADLKRLRSLNVTRKTGLERLKHLPVEAVTAWDPIPDWPLRYFSGDLSHFQGDIHRLEFAEPSDGQPPAALQGARRLRGLWLSNVAELPEWLAELPALEHLHLTNYSVPFEPKAFAVLERMPHLRSLELRITVNHRQAPGMAELDLSRLEQLSWLGVPDHYYPGSVLPRGLERLRFLQIGGELESARTRVDRQCEILLDCNGLYGLACFRAMTYNRSFPEWWLSRFDVNSAPLFESLSRFYRPPGS